MIAIPLTNQADYTELKFALRSIEKYLPDQEILIIGDMIPEWLTNVIQIDLPDIPGRKQLSIRRKILAALQYADEILFLNDDIFFTEPWIEFPYYYHGELKHYSETGSKPLLKELELMCRLTLHFDGHMPIVYKQDFKEVSEHFTNDVILKSMYCNYLGLLGTFIPDCKIQREMKPEQVRNFILDKKCFSTSTFSIRSTLFILHELFPKPSKYEI